MKNKFKLYQTIKQKISTQYKGYDLSEIISLDIIWHIYHQGREQLDKIRYKDLCLKFQEFPKVAHFGKIFQHNGALLTIPKNQNKRDDYREFIDLIKGKINNCHLEPIEIFTQTKILDFKTFEFLEFLFIALRIFLQSFPLLTIKEALYFGQKILFYKRVIKELESFKNDDIKIKKYVAFNAALSVENLLVSFFKKRGIKTYSLQHAMVDRYFLDQESPSYDLINIENMKADYLLCWSLSTIEQIRNYGLKKTELLLVGNPKYTQLKLSNIKQSFKKCLVFLAGIGDEFTNSKVISIIQEISQEIKDIDFIFKLHPQHINTAYSRQIETENKLNILPINQTLSSLLIEQDFDFTISYNMTTTVYYESMCYGMICLRYKERELINQYGLANDFFSDGKELKEKILYFKQVEQSTLMNQIQEILKYTVGINMDYYGEYLS